MATIPDAINKRAQFHKKHPDAALVEELFGIYEYEYDEWGQIPYRRLPIGFQPSPEYDMASVVVPGAAQSPMGQGDEGRNGQSDGGADQASVAKPKKRYRGRKGPQPKPQGKVRKRNDSWRAAATQRVMKRFAAGSTSSLVRRHWDQTGSADLFGDLVSSSRLFTYENSGSGFDAEDAAGEEVEE